MSKRKDRLFEDYRNCPRCGSKAITVIEFQTLFIRKRFIECHNCCKDTLVKAMD